jgi:hypothetical protein
MGLFEKSLKGSNRASQASHIIAQDVTQMKSRPKKITVVKTLEVPFSSKKHKNSALQRERMRLTDSITTYLSHILYL